MEDDIEQDILLSCSIGDVFWLKKSLIGREKFINEMFNNEGLTPLHLVAYHRNPLLVEYLLTQCARVIDINVETLHTGDTPLHLLVSTTCSNNATTNDSMSNVIECAQLLLNKGVSYDKKNCKGQTPLHLAAKSGLTSIVELLIEEGADFTIKDNRNQTPNDMARLYGNYECSRILSALHWAKDKDSHLRHRLQTERQNTKERTLQKKVQSHLKKRQGDIAYKMWLNQNGFSPPPPPPSLTANTSKTRLSCRTCLSSSSTMSQTPESSNDEELTHSETCIPISTIQITLNQAEHNIQAIGKPHKLYPYSNYPPKQYRIHSASSSGRDHMTRRPFSCATSGRVTPKKSTHSLRVKSAPTRLAAATPCSTTKSKNTTSNRMIKVTNYKERGLKEVKKLEATTNCYGDHIKDTSEDIKMEESSHCKVKRDNEKEEKGEKEIEEVIKGTEVKEEKEEKEEEKIKEEKQKEEEKPEEDDEGGSSTSIDGLMFHEVGQENDLQSLVAAAISPTNSDKGEGEGEGLAAIPPISAFELLQVFAERSSQRNLQRQNKHRTSRQHSLARKPTDLVSIPEGEYVNCYNEFEDSQLFDNELLYSLMPFAFHSDAPAPPPSSPHEPHPPYQNEPHSSLKQAWDSLPPMIEGHSPSNDTHSTQPQVTISKIKTPHLSSPTSPTSPTSRVPLKTSVFEFGGNLNR